MTTGGAVETVTMGRLRGHEITFTAGDIGYKGTVTGNTINGTMTTPNGPLPWAAKRQ